MKTFWNGADRAEIAARVGKITPATSALWGKMDAPRMVAHLADWFRMALGDIPIPQRNLPVRHFPLKQILMYVLPFPKNLPTAPELQRQPTSLDEELALLRDGMERFGNRDANGSWGPHPAFGEMSGHAWGALAYKHTDHHLRQFGL